MYDESIYKLIITFSVNDVKCSDQKDQKDVSFLGVSLLICF